MCFVRVILYYVGCMFVASLLNHFWFWFWFSDGCPVWMLIAAYYHVIYCTLLSFKQIKMRWDEKRCDLKRQQKIERERGAAVTCDGRLFHRRAAVTGNALSPTVDKRVCHQWLKQDQNVKTKTVKQQQEYTTEKNSSVATRMFVIKKITGCKKKSKSDNDQLGTVSVVIARKNASAYYISALSCYTASFQAQQCWKQDQTYKIKTKAARPRPRPRPFCNFWLALR